MTGAVIQCAAAPADDPAAPVHARVGIVGGGQLARMTHAAASRRLGPRPVSPRTSYRPRA